MFMSTMEVLGTPSYIFFFKQKTAYEMVSCDWSSDVCSSDLAERERHADRARRAVRIGAAAPAARPGGPRRGGESLHPAERRPRGGGAAARLHRDDGRLQDRRTGPEGARHG